MPTILKNILHLLAYFFLTIALEVATVIFLIFFFPLRNLSSKESNTFAQAHTAAEQDLSKSRTSNISCCEDQVNKKRILNSQ